MDWNKGGSFETIEPGTYVGVCCKIIDIGTQRGEWKGKPTATRKVILTWELSKKMEDGKPFHVSAWVTQSLDEKATLRKFLVSWRGTDFTKEEVDTFEPKELLGQAAGITVVMNANGKSKVTGVNKLIEGTPVHDLSVMPIYFSLDHREFNQETFDALPDGIKKYVEDSPEYKKLAGMGMMDADPTEEEKKAMDKKADDDDIPF